MICFHIGFHLFMFKNIFLTFKIIESVFNNNPDKFRSKSKSWVVKVCIYFGLGMLK